MQINSADATIALGDNDTVIITSPSGKANHWIEVWERDPGDLEVAFIVPGKRRGRFEQLLIGSATEEDAVAREAVRLVCNLVEEHTVLAWDRRLLRGGRQFIDADKLSSRVRQNLSWVVSWRGTYSSDAPAV